MAKRRRSSTDREKVGPAYAPAAIDFGELDDLGELLRVDWGVLEDDDDCSELRRVMSDPARVDAQLSRLPALGLLICEILAEAGGVAQSSAVERVLRERTGLEEVQIARFVRELEGDGVLVPVVRVSRPSEKALALLSPAAERVAERTWLSSAPAPAVPKEILELEEVPATELSPMLAVAGLALHEPIKHTMAGAPHGTNVKKHARRLAMQERELERLVARAASTGALRPDASGAYTVDASRMAALASGAGLQGTVGRLVHGWLADGPKPAEVVLRALVRHRAAEQSQNFLHSMWYREPVDRTVAIARDQLAQVSGLRRLEVGSVAWLARARMGAELPAEVEGFVTPNLDVMIGPEPDPRIVARLALGAELVHIDHVLTFVLRPKTVARGVLCGLSGEELVDVLARVGRHGVPDGVRAQVLDWSAGARVASAQAVTLLRFPPRLQDEVVGVLGDLFMLAPAPGVALVAAGPPLERLRERLAAIGVEVSGSVAKAPERASDEPHEAAIAPPPLPLDHRGDPALRQKIADERALGFAPSMAWIEERSAAGALATIDWSAIRARVRSAPADVQRATTALIELHERDGAELDAWLARQPPSMRDCIDVVSAMALVMVPVQHRRRLLASSAPALEVIAEANRILARGWASPAGKKALNALSKVDRERMYAFLRGLAAGPEEPRAAPPVATTGELMAGLRELSGADIPVQLWWDAGDGPCSARVWIDELRARGRESVVLVTEVETERARVLPLGSVRSIELA